MEAPLLPVLPGYDRPELIAHGATALVFRAVQRRLNRLVAIKVINLDTGSTMINAERELATTVALSSQPHIVSIIDTGVTDDDRPYIVMEYCEGGSYAQILRQRGPLPVDEVIEVGIKIGEALHAAHQAGIVHRDVKPSNILRSRFGPALTDFGIARAPDELGGTLTREMMTPHHASPEALLHQAQSGLSDVYSLASTLWTLLVGHPPFVDPTKPAADIYAFRDVVLHDSLPPMPRPDVPAWLVAELARAMAKLPAQRHSSALDFAEALRRGALGLRTAPARGAPPQSRTEVHTPGRPSHAWPAAPTRMSVPAPSTVGSDEPPDPPSRRPGAARPAAAYDEAPVYIPPSSSPSHLPDLEEEGGWLDPVADDAWPDPGTAVLPPPRGRGDAAVPATRRRLATTAAALAVVAVVAVGAAAVLLMSYRGGDGLGARGTAASVTAGSGGSTRFITAATQGAPTQVALRNDRGTSVTISWTDPSAGGAPFLVVGRGPDGVTLEPMNLPRGTTTATFQHLDPAKNYCFLVGAVYSYDRVATAPEVCTHR